MEKNGKVEGKDFLTFDEGNSEWISLIIETKNI
jgi:hypothetical protein